MNRLCVASIVLAATVIGVSATAADLTQAEQAAGWRMLFDGETWNGWRGYRKDGPPAQGWSIEDGTLHVRAGGGGGDIVTEDIFADFELSLEFKVASAANSGIIYRVDESQPYPWMTGPEFQILDDAASHERQFPSHTVGSVYDLYIAAETKPLKLAGEWNTARIQISDGIVKHFLNGMKVAQYDMNSEEWADKIARSKFRDMKGFGVQEKGRISLQDHGDDVWYRNIKIRDLDAVPVGATEILRDRSTDNWFAYFGNAEAAEPLISTSGNPVLRISGEPKGFLRTTQKHDDFILRLDWRYPEEAGNSGVLLRSIGPDKVWPNCIEAQLMSGNAGDFVNMTGERMTMPRAEGRFGRKSHNAENPLGEWNTYEIIAQGGEITLFVNGEKLNHATGCPTRAGYIALQSEGVPIEFRNILLIPLD
mgnify:CR=1 FL=1